MDEKELRSMVERMVLELAGKPAAVTATRPASRQEDVSQGCLEDITQIDLRRQYLVDNPRSGQAFQDLKLKTPARLGLGRAGARYRTISMLRMRADHAAAQRAVSLRTHTAGEHQRKQAEYHGKYGHQDGAQAHRCSR